MELDVRRLRVLREVALRGTVTAAAGSLGFTPSAVSQQLSALERESGVTLLERAGRRVRLTDAGQVLVQRTEPVLAALEEAQAALEESRDSIAGELRIAAAGSIARALVIPMAARIAAARPALRATVLECETGDGMRELLLGHLDVVVAHEYSGSEGRPPDGAAPGRSVHRGHVRRRTCWAARRSRRPCGIWPVRYGPPSHRRVPADRRLVPHAVPRVSTPTSAMSAASRASCSPRCAVRAPSRCCPGLQWRGRHRGSTCCPSLARVSAASSMRHIGAAAPAALVSLSFLPASRPPRPSCAR